MHRYFIKTPPLLRALYGSYEWTIPSKDTVYLSFDDGPHPEITPWVLEQLAATGAKATFFCIGDNVARYPSVYEEVLKAGHAVGNHTFHHYNGWKVDDAAYLQDIAQAATLIDSNLFRPPYGRIRRSQARGVKRAMDREDARIIMWDVLSGDFDRTFGADRCADNVLRHAVPGSVIVFHDSEKAYGNLSRILPRIIGTFKEKGWKMEAIGGAINK